MRFAIASIFGSTKTSAGEACGTDCGIGGAFASRVRMPEKSLRNVVHVASAVSSAAARIVGVRAPGHALIDTDGDGQVNVTMVDTDQDGQPDAVVDGDGGHAPTV